MKNKKIKLPLEIEFNDLRRRVWKIENPPKYKVGDLVLTEVFLNDTPKPSEENKPMELDVLVIDINFVDGDEESKPTWIYETYHAGLKRKFYVYESKIEKRVSIIEEFDY